MPADERVAVLVVRAWREDGGPTGLRARVTWVDDVEQGREQTAAASSVEDVLTVVRRWLDALSADTAP
jgi:hypothetical protein